MNFGFKPILRALGSRLARNIYLWIVILYLVLDNDSEGRVYDAEVYYKGVFITTLIIFVFTYINNLLLVPRLLAKKKTALYFLTASLSLLFFSIVYVASIKLFIEHYPKVRTHQISLITSPLTTEWSTQMFYWETQSFIFGLFMWMLIMTFAWFTNDYMRQQKMLEQIKQEQVTTELHFLKNQINPHFLFNTLNNLYGLALKKSDKNPDAILRLSSILRYLLYDSNTPLASFQKEAEMMKAYIDLELLRLPEQQDFTFTINADKDYSIPPLLWLPILENVFKHATGIIAQKYFIDYSFTINNNILSIYSKNNYKNLVKADAKNGIGLSNLRKRLDLLYAGAYMLETSADEEFYTTRIEIKL
jgi:two-component system, LytTR family, sensor kinase